MNTAVQTKLSLAKDSISLKKYSDARLLCEQILKEDFNNLEAMFLLGKIHFHQNDFARAEEFFTKILFIHPNHYDSIVELSLLFEKQNNRKKAAKYREMAFRISQSGL